MHNSQDTSNEHESIFFLPDIFNETLSLLLEAHEYFEHHGRTEQNQLPFNNRMLYSREMSRITMRLSCIMAWIMAQKAVAGGHISPQRALEEYRLDGKEYCLTNDTETDSMLPPSMSQLLNNSYSLYSRVNRLDEQMANNEQTQH